MLGSHCFGRTEGLVRIVFWEGILACFYGGSVLVRPFKKKEPNIMQQPKVRRPVLSVAIAVLKCSYSFFFTSLSLMVPI